VSSFFEKEREKREETQEREKTIKFVKCFRFDEHSFLVTKIYLDRTGTKKNKQIQKNFANSHLASLSTTAESIIGCEVRI
jgi:hypothetical protein